MCYNYYNKVKEIVMNCQKCGAEINADDKYCEYCKTLINPDGKDYLLNGTGECFVVNDIFSISGRSLIIGNTIQPLRVGDRVYSSKKHHCKVHLLSLQCQQYYLIQYQYHRR